MTTQLLRNQVIGYDPIARTNYRAVKLFRNFGGGGIVLADQSLTIRNPNIIEIINVPDELSDLEIVRRANNSHFATERQQIWLGELATEMNLGQIITD